MSRGYSFDLRERAIALVEGGCRDGQRSGRSCPLAWCSLIGVIARLAGKGRIGQAATAGSATAGSSLKDAMVSSVM